MKKLIADQFRDDPRVTEALELLQSTWHEYATQLRGVQEPDRDTPLFEAAKRLRGTPLALPYIGSGIGNGCFVELADGSVKLDMIGGIGAIPGHRLDLPLSDLVMQGNLQQNQEAIELMEQLTTSSGMDHCFLSTAGAMACENGLKIAFQKRFPRSRVLAYRGCFMGRTLGAAWVTDKPAGRKGLPQTLEVDYIPFDDPNLEVLEGILRRYPDQHAVMVMELVQGEGGVHVGHRETFERLVARLREAGILIMVDEVQTFARTEQLFAFQHFGIEPDIVTIGKLAQVCATLFRSSVAPEPGLLAHTFISSSSAIQKSLSLLKALQEGFYGPDGKNARLFARFKQRIPQAVGLGLMWAIDHPRPVELMQTLFRNGLISFIATDRVRMLPPILAVDEEAVDLAADILERSMAECL